MLFEIIRRKKNEPIIDKSINAEVFLKVFDIGFVIEIVAPNERYEAEIFGNFDRFRIAQQIFRVEVDALK